MSALNKKETDTPYVGICLLFVYLLSSRLASLFVISCREQLGSPRT